MKSTKDEIRAFMVSHTTDSFRRLFHMIGEKLFRFRCLVFESLGPVVQSPISANPGSTLNKSYGVNPGLVLIGL